MKKGSNGLYSILATRHRGVSHYLSHLLLGNRREYLQILLDFFALGCNTAGVVSRCNEV